MSNTGKYHIALLNVEFFKKYNKVRGEKLRINKNAGIFSLEIYQNDLLVKKPRESANSFNCYFNRSNRPVITYFSNC